MCLSEKRFHLAHTKSAHIHSSFTRPFKSHSLATVDGGPQQTLLTNFAGFGNWNGIRFVSDKEKCLTHYQQFILHKADFCVRN